jgi:hypothetical protein
MVVCCGLVYEVGMRNTPDVGTVVVGLARNDACLWRVVACLRSSPWIGYLKTLQAVCCATLSGVSQSAGLFVEPGVRRSRIMKT